ncbi:MAG: hypothetical protein LQ347_000393 [Umbilicaria vellea]|nr:MAG: hypothetical protein LQ347_000393 [Umbilicaria vellea]
MAPQESIPVAANILGTIGTIFWCVQLIPQIWYNWKQKKTDGLPGAMMFIWALCGVPFGVYAIVQYKFSHKSLPPYHSSVGVKSLSTTSTNAPGRSQPVLSLIRSSQWKPWKAALLSASIAAAFGGVEALLILTLRVKNPIPVS